MSIPPRFSERAEPSQPSEEARMRRALGLRDDEPSKEGAAFGRPGEQPRPVDRPVIQRREADRRTRRFVKDGEVPVVVLHGSREHGGEAPAPINRLAAAESALEAERAARDRVERSLHEALATVQHLQTQVAHADLAQSEALAAERQARETAEEALAASQEALAAAIVARDALEERLQKAEAPPPAAPPRRASRKAPVETSEPQPIKWWLPSYKSKRRQP